MADAICKIFVSQVTDLHLSHHHTARANDLLQLLEFVLTASSGAPPCFIVSRDLTDAKLGWFALHPQAL